MWKRMEWPGCREASLGEGRGCCPGRPGLWLPPKGSQKQPVAAAQAEGGGRDRASWMSSHRYCVAALD